MSLEHDLAALADGSLAPERRTALEARVAASSALAELLAEQRRVVALTRRAATAVEAPAALRARIEAQRRPRRRVQGIVLAGAAAAGAAALLVFNPSTTGERLHAELAATRLAPGATGAATLMQTAAGWRIALNARGLPRLANGRFYEAWLRNPDGVLVPIGTFNQGPNVTLWAGVSPQRFTTLTVTREMADSNQRSSGETVLVGQIDARD
jgi:anti-sigma factor RsiW